MGRGYPGFPSGGRSLRAAAVDRRPTDEVESCRLQTLSSVLFDYFDTKIGRKPRFLPIFAFYQVKYTSNPSFPITRRMAALSSSVRIVGVRPLSRISRMTKRQSASA